MTRDELNAFIQSVVALRESATDKAASVAVSAYPGLHGDGRTIQAGTRINHNGKLLRAAVTLFDNEQSTPEVAPTLWEEIMYRDGIRIIPEIITPGLAFFNGEKGWWKDTIWVSTMDDNVWNPETNPVAWKQTTFE